MARSHSARRAARSAARLVAIALSLSAAHAHADDDDTVLARALDRSALVRLAAGRSPAVRAALARGDTLVAEANAEGKWPPPQAMVQLWKVPLAKPYALGSADMLMVGLSQEIPAFGARSARREASAIEATAAVAMASDRGRMVVRAAELAFADYVESSERHRVHGAHARVAERTFAAAEARHAAGGPLTDVVQADAERARARAEVETDAARIEASRAVINALLGRPAPAPLGAPRAGDPEAPDASLDGVLERARSSRPDLKVFDAERRAREASRLAADREATWPAFNVALLYFAPVGANPMHGYGTNLSMSLPWLWGSATAKHDAAARAVDAAGATVESARRDVEIEVTQTYGAAVAASRMVAVLRDAALPAQRRFLEAAWSGYESGRSALPSLLSAERAVVETEGELVRARATLDRALADLDAAAGFAVPRRPIAPLGAVSPEGGSHGR